MTFNDLASRVADTYDALEHAPTDPAVTRAYAALCSALRLQYRELTSRVRVEFTTLDPYPTAAALFDDMADHMLTVYTLADLPAGHPFACIAPGYGWTTPYNLMFRAVHDGLAHYPGRHNFSALGEFAAFKAHARMLAGNVPAIHALATETLSQNCWVNFGRVNRGLEQSAQVYAPQKAALLPWNLVRQALTEVTL